MEVACFSIILSKLSLSSGLPSISLANYRFISGNLELVIQCITSNGFISKFLTMRNDKMWTSKWVAIFPFRKFLKILHNTQEVAAVPGSNGLKL